MSLVRVLWVMGFTAFVLAATGLLLGVQGVPAGVRAREIDPCAVLPLAQSVIVGSNLVLSALALSVMTLITAAFTKSWATVGWSAAGVVGAFVALFFAVCFAYASRGGYCE